MTTKIKRIKPERVAVIHNCTQEEQIKKLSMILVGNGNPEDGYVYKVIKLGDHIEAINEKLTGISGIVKELHEDSVAKKAVGKTSDQVKVDHREKLRSILTVISTIVIACGLITTAYFGFVNSRKNDIVENKVESLGTPVLTNPRGVIMGVPDSTQIRFWPKDFNDTNKPMK
jgi:hypothetical protein